MVVHLLVFFLWWGEPLPESPFAAAGPRTGDNRAASGGAMQTLNLRIPPPRPIIRPQVPLLTFDPIPPVELEEEQPGPIPMSRLRLGSRGSWTLPPSRI